VQKPRDRKNLRPRRLVADPLREPGGSGKGRIRRIAIVTVARKLLIALWRYLEAGMVPAGDEVALFRAALA